METLFLKQERLLAQTSTRIVRELMHTIHWDNRLIAIRGSRGVGKTTLMLQYIKLNPIISQVARFTFTIEKGTGVNTLEPLAAGIEVSGLQNPIYHDEQLTYNWSSEKIADTLVMRIGDKREWVTLPGDEVQVEDDGTLTADIAVLPTMTMSTPIAVLINLAINGVPTQYMTLLNEQMLLHARSYNLKWEVSVKEGQISVVTWQNQSWVTDLVNEE